jgi:hypothetical protein
VERHLAAIRERLTSWAEWVRARLGPGSDDDALVEAFTAAVGAEVRHHFDEAAARRFEQAVGVRYCWGGLARYWRKLEERQQRQERG